jgi:hypothetical protein
MPQLGERGFSTQSIRWNSPHRASDGNINDQLSRTYQKAEWMIIINCHDDG